MDQPLRLHLRKEDDVADGFLAEEHHAETVDAHAHAARRGHAVLQRDKKIFVELLLFAAGLMFEAFALFDGVILLGIGRRDFLAVDAAFKDLHGRRVIGREFGEEVPAISDRIVEIDRAMRWVTRTNSAHSSCGMRLDLKMCASAWRRTVGRSPRISRPCASLARNRSIGTPMPAETCTEYFDLVAAKYHRLKERPGIVVVSDLKRARNHQEDVKRCSSTWATVFCASSFTAR